MEFLIYLLLIFNLIFPKAGWKIDNIPIYFGVILAGIISPLMYYKIIVNLKGKTIELKFLILTITILIFNLIIPFYTLNIVNINFIIIVIYTIIIYPVFFFLPFYFRKINYIKVLKYCVIILIMYGYIQKIFGDYNVVIPGLTANYTEALRSNFLHHKNNLIHSLNYLKLTSTYQNGNLFGLNITLLFWTAIKYFKHKNFLILCYIPIIILSGSASTYIANIGLIMFIIFYKILLSFDIKFGKFLLGITVVSIILFFILIQTDNIIINMLKVRFLNRDITKGGGRIENITGQITMMKSIVDYLFGLSLKTSNISEMILVNTFIRFGIFGLIFFFIRIILFINFKLPIAIYIGIIGYFINSLFDSAINYPPVYFNYFFILGFIYAEGKRRNKYESGNNT